MVKLISSLLVLLSTAALAQDRWLVAARDLAAGEAIDVVVIDAPRNVLPHKVVVTEGSLPHVKDQRLSVPLLKGDVILWSALQRPPADVQQCQQATRKSPNARSEVSRARSAVLRSSKK